MRNLVECLGEVQVEHVYIGTTVKKFGHNVQVLQEVGDGGAVLKKAMLGHAK